jgi:hypothetical protein
MQSEVLLPMPLQRYMIASREYHRTTTKAKKGSKES